MKYVMGLILMFVPMTTYGTDNLMYAAVSGANGDGFPAILAHGKPAGTFATGSLLYFADEEHGSVRVVDWSTPDGVIATVPGTEGQFSRPTDVVQTPDGTIYVSDTERSRVYRVTPGGVMVAAGTGTRGYNGDGIPATEAELNGPTQLAVDPSGYLVIVDTGNHRIRFIDEAGMIQTRAGGGWIDQTADGIPAVGAYIQFPIGVAFADDGSWYVLGNTGLLRRIDQDDTIHTVAQLTDSFGGMATAADLAITPTTLYVAGGSFPLVYAIDRATYEWEIFAGSQSESGNSGNASVPLDARFGGISAVAADGEGRVFITDATSHTIRVASMTPWPPVRSAPVRSAPVCSAPVRSAPVRGDLDGDGRVTGADAMILINLVLESP